MNNKRRILLFVPILLWASRASAQEGFSFFTSDFPPEEFASRRAGVYDAIGKGAIAVLQGAPTPVGYTRFRQSNDFYYLCGVEVPNAFLVLDGSSRKAILYLPHRNEGRSVGSRSDREADGGAGALEDVSSSGFPLEMDVGANAGATCPAILTEAKILRR